MTRGYPGFFQLVCLRIVVCLLLVACLAGAGPGQGMASPDGSSLSASQEAVAAPEVAEPSAVPLSSATHIKAGVFLSPPFVMDDGKNGFKGFAIDLWREIETALELKTVFIRYYSVEGLLRAVKNGDIDVIVGNLTVSHKRALEMELTYPWYDAGLRIMIPSENAASVLEELRESGDLAIYLLLILLFLVLTWGITVLRRRNEDHFPRQWGDGLSLSFYEIIVAVKFGRLPMGGRYGWKMHIAVGLWVIFGVGIIAYFTSSMTSAMTTVSLGHELFSPTDIYEMKVGAETGSVAEDYLTKMGIRVVSYENVLECIEALVNEEVEAVVADAPVLEYWVRRHPKADLEVVGARFRPDRYSFGLPRGHTSLSRRISLEIMRLQETGKLHDLQLFYFGRRSL